MGSLIAIIIALSVGSYVIGLCIGYKLGKDSKDGY